MDNLLKLTTKHTEHKHVSGKIMKIARMDASLLMKLVVTIFIVTFLAHTNSNFGIIKDAGAAVTDPCLAPANAIVAENCKLGNPQSEWDVVGAGDPSIQGFATDISFNVGDVASFKVDTDATNYQLDIYRVGYYEGNGARKIDTVLPTAALPQNQPTCLNDAGTGLIDCGNWNVSATWTIPANATSGIYIARLVRPDTGGASHIYFIVRNDSGNSDLLFQTSDTTWQAYNDYGGNSLYTGSPIGRGYKVSYNRPFRTRGNQYKRAFLFGAEYPMVRWLEANGYDVSYFTGVDADRRGAEILEHKAYLSVGHDEYWSGTQRANVELARNNNVNLAFFSGNEMFWKTRWEPSIDGSGKSHRTLVSYKETHANAKIDPIPEVWTGTWRDPRFSPPADGGRPENALSGTIYTVNCCLDGLAINVPESFGKLRFWRDTSMATLLPGQVGSLPSGVLGYEWDEALDNGFAPAGLIRMSSTVVNLSSLYLLNYGSTYGSGRATHSLTSYRHTSGSLVFSAGTVRWSWGLDGNHDVDPAFPVANALIPDVRMQQATTNLFADMGIQPKNIQAGLVLASQSSDVTQPTSTITSPAAGLSIQSGDTVTVTGTASDADGIIANVEVSTDGGASWHLATGRESWSYTWIPSTVGLVTLKSRAIDDSSNQEIIGSGVTVTVNAAPPPSCPCKAWDSAVIPTNLEASDTASVELGVKLRSDVAGSITGIRFYKGVGNTGTHIGHLWTASGNLLASATFTDETSSGWQQVNFEGPVTISANTVYVVSYLAPNGKYSYDSGYFATKGVDSAPLHLLQSDVSGKNGVFVYGSGGFPNQSYNDTNYWVDPVFDGTVAADTVSPKVFENTPKNAAKGVSIDAIMTAIFNEAMDATTINSSSFELRDENNAVVPSTVTYNLATNTAKLTPTNSLLNGKLFNAKVKGGSSGVKDSAGNALVADYGWSFTTAKACPCNIWSALDVPLNLEANDTASIEVGVKFSSDVDGSITGVRFYKGVGNTGVHVGHLWTNAGVLLATATFTNESTSGWQQVNFDNAVSINANQIYVVSYLAPNGKYSFDSRYFSLQGVDNAPLHAPKNSAVSGGNGVFSYGNGEFPSRSFNSTNYWVDVVFSSDKTPPTVLGNTPSNGATGVSLGAVVTATFNEAMKVATINNSTIELRDAANLLVPSTVTYGYETNTVSLTPSTPLVSGVPYTVKIISGSTGVKDLVGNALVTDFSWSFTTLDNVEPTAPGSLTAASSASIQVYVSWAASSDNVGVTGYSVERCQGLGCTAFAQVATSTLTNFSDSGLLSGVTYQYRVRAFDAAGNFSAYSAITSVTTLDTVSPSSPSSLSVTPINGSNNTLVWAASTDNVGVAGYRVERCLSVGCSSFLEIASPTVTSYSDTGLLPNTSYQYRVRAIDAAGNLSAYSNVVLVKQPANVPPSVTITAPTNGTSFRQGTPIVIAASANDTDGSVVKVEFYADNILRSSSTVAPYSYTWTSATVGSHSIIAKAYDNHGAVTSSTTVGIRVLSNTIFTSSIFGGLSGTTFKDTVATNQSLTGVNVRNGWWIDNIQGITNTGTLPAHGGTGGNLSVATLNIGEYFVGIRGFYGTYVGQISLVTNTGRILGAYGLGLSGNNTFSFNYTVPAGYEIVGFTGRSATYLNAIGVLYRSR